MLAGFAAVIGAMAVFNRQINRRIDDTNRRIDDVKHDVASVRQELHALVLHLIPRPPARKQERAYETAPEQGVVREKPKK